MLHYPMRLFLSDFRGSKHSPRTTRREDCLFILRRLCVYLLIRVLHQRSRMMGTFPFCSRWHVWESMETLPKVWFEKGWMPSSKYTDRAPLAMSEQVFTFCISYVDEFWNNRSDFSYSERINQSLSATPFRDWFVHLSSWNLYSVVRSKKISIQLFTYLSLTCTAGQQQIWSLSLSPSLSPCASGGSDHEFTSRSTRR